MESISQTSHNTIDQQQPKKIVKHIRNLSSAGLANSTSLLVSGSSTSIDKQPSRPVSQFDRASSNSLSNNSLAVNLNHGAQIDDNNFINNTFSFLDDLDNNNEEFISLDQPVTKLNTLTETLEVSTRSEDLETLISPAKSENDPVERKLNGRSKTLSFEPSQEKESRLCAKLSSFSSKAKPIAPKIKSSVTIGVASGVEALKAINILSCSSNKDLSDKVNETQSGEFTGNRKLLQDIRMQQKLEEERIRRDRPSITRIIKGDSSLPPTNDQSGGRDNQQGFEKR